MVSRNQNKTLVAIQIIVRDWYPQQPNKVARNMQIYHEPCKSRTKQANLSRTMQKLHETGKFITNHAKVALCSIHFINSNSSNLALDDQINELFNL